MAFGHEASFITLVGLLISYFYWKTDKTGMQSVVEFNDDIFFYVCLPPLVFASGFNMQRKKFFENISNILLFGVGGTVTTFIVFAVLTFWLQAKADDGTITIMQTDWSTGETSPVHLSAMEILLMCALLCSTDVIAAISMVNYDEQPKLFSLLFGEGVVNDAVAIILFNSVVKFEDKELNATTGGLIVFDFIKLSVFSLLIGMFFGFASSLMLKYLRMLTRDAIVECIVMFSFGYLAYVAAETCKQSGIISLLTTGVIMGQYTWYNLSPQGKQGSALVFQFLGNAVQGFIFSYLGLTFFAYQDFTWSFSLTTWLMPIVIVGRFAGTLFLLKAFDCCGWNSGIRTIEVFFMGFAGLIRGAIAFGLVLRLDDTLPNRSVIVTTALTIVVFTTIFFGCLVGLVSVLTKEPAKTEDDSASAAQDNDYFQINGEQKDVAINQGVSVSLVDKPKADDDKSDHGEFHHPNEDLSDNISQIPPLSSAAADSDTESSGHEAFAEDGMELEGKKPKVPTTMSCFSRFLFKLDYHYLRPCLIYKFSYKKQLRDDQFFDQFDKGAKELKKMHFIVRSET